MGEKKSSVECRVESNHFGSLTYFWKQLKGNGVHRMIAPVVCNMLLTLWAWTTVYEMKHDDALIAKLFYTSDDKLWDALKNGTTVVATLICTAFFLLALVMLDFKRLIQCWLYIACAAILFAVSGSFFHDALVKFIPDHGEKAFFFLGFGTTVFGFIGLGAFFLDFLPAFVHQFYVVVNCSFISLIYLRILPGYTAWIVLGSLVFWDLFAVLTPYGPLRIVQDKAADYRADILRFLMFTSPNVEESDEDEDDDSDSEGSVASKKSAGPGTDSSASDASTSDESNDSDSSSGSDSESSVYNMVPKKRATKTKGIKTAADALDDDSARLGMGDFVFYGVLAGAAASSGSVVGTFAAVFGVVYGLILTFTIPFDTKYTVPALPISVCLGAFYHFTTIYIESYFSDTE